MDEVWLFLLTFVASSCVSTVSAFVGGGGGIIMIPYFLLIGLNPATAIGTSKFGGLGSTIGSLPQYKKALKIDHKLALRLLPITLVASVIGPNITLNLDLEVAERAIGVIVLLMAPTIFINKETLATRFNIQSKKIRMLGYIVFGAFAIAQTAFGTGIGALLMVVLVIFFDLDVIKASATRLLAGIPTVTITTVIFIVNDTVSYILAPALIAGSIMGGSLGAKLAIKHGATKVKYALFVSLIFIGFWILLS